MQKIRTLGLGVLSVIALVLAPVAFAAADQSNPQSDPAKGPTAAALACRRQSAANGSGQDILLSTGDPRTYTGTAWQNVECTTTTFRLAFGQRALVVADFTAEADCHGTSPTNGQWCQTRALLNGIEGSPVAAEPSSFAFDSVAGGANNWQAHAMNRGWEIRCGSSNGCQYRFAVQTRMHNTTVSSLWLDEVAAHLRVTYGNPAPL
ncbi:MAG: hypothetical protein AAB834_04425 [Patescibacteria group bacterium]